MIELFEDILEVVEQRLDAEARAMLANPSEKSTAVYYKGQTGSLVFGDLIGAAKDVDAIYSDLFRLVAEADHPLASKLRVRLVDMYVSATAEKEAEEIEREICGGAQ